MTTNIRPLPLGQGAERAWRIAQLVREGAMDRNAAQFSLSLLYQQTDNARLRHLCARIAEGLPAPPSAEPIVESFAH